MHGIHPDVVGPMLHRSRLGQGADGAAKDRDEARQGRTIFAAFNVRLDDAGEKPVAVEIQMGQGNALLSPSFYIEGLSAIVINLTVAFHGVRFP
jgi:hypothetical protein